MSACGFIFLFWYCLFYPCITNEGLAQSLRANRGHREVRGGDQVQVKVRTKLCTCQKKKKNLSKSSIFYLFPLPIKKLISVKC